MSFRFAAVLFIGLLAGHVFAQSVMTNPVPGSVLGASTVAFQWTDSSGAGATDYGLSVGTTGPGSSDLFYAQYGIVGTAQTVMNVPTNANVYVRLTTWGPVQTIGSPQDYVYNDDVDDDGIRNAVDPAPNAANAKFVRVGTNYTLTLLGSGRLASLQVDAAAWDAAADGLDYEDYKPFTRMIYQQLADDFDFIFFSHDQGSAPLGSPYVGQHVGAQNTIQGIGKNVFNATAAFGSSGRLLGAMHLITRGAIQTGPSLHEIMHQWANDLDTATFPQVGSGASGHWGASSVGGTLGGFDVNSLVDLGGGLYQVKKFNTFTGAANTTPYAPLELYCAGLVPAADVPDTKIAIGFANYTSVSATTATFNASYISNVPVATIVAANGVRSPSSTNAQKRFRLLHVVLCKTPLSNPVWADIDERTHYFGLEGTNNQPPLLNFWQATGGRAALEVTNLTASLLSTSVTTTLVTLVANPTNGGVVSGGGSYTSGASIVITAVGSIGWVFNFWNDGVTNASRTITVPPTNITYTANFSLLGGGSPSIVTGATTLLAENCLPTNGAVDPVETVTVNIALRNAGSGATTNVMATLLANGGVYAPGAAQAYGALAPGGTNVARAFSFTAVGACGGVITGVLQITDGATGLGSIPVVLPLGLADSALNESFDGTTAPTLPAGWTTTASGGQPNWVTTTTNADSVPNVAFSDEATTIGENALVSPAVSIASSSARLSFRHTYNMDFDGDAWDGGVLEIKIGAGSFQDILTAGGAFVTNGYGYTLQVTGNPLGGRFAWGGNSGGYKTTVVVLPAAAAGQSVQFRWRLGTDASVGGQGWRIDDVALTDLVCCTPPPPNIVRLAAPNAPNLVVHSIGNGVYPLVAEYTTNLLGTPDWQPATANTIWSNGTNVTTFTAPPGVNPAIIRVKQAISP